MKTITRRNTLSLAGAAGAYSLFGTLGCDDGGGPDGTGGGSAGGPGATGATGATGSSGSSTGNTTGAGGGSGGSCVPAMEAVVGSYAALNLRDHPIYSIDMTLQDYPLWSAHPDSGEVREHEVGIWWDGGDALRTHPPTVGDRGSGIGSLFNLWQDATLEIRELNFRFEWQAGPEYCSRTNGNLPKLVIVNTTTRPNPSADAVARPMLYWREVTTADNGDFNLEDTLAICPAQGTTQSWSETEYSENGTAWPMQYQPVYWADTAGTFKDTSLPVLAATEIVTIEMRMIAIATPEYPRGLIAVRVYRRNGDVFERGMPWDLDRNHAVGISYIQEVQMFGGGYYNNANAFHENVYTRVGGHITLARACGGWLGPRAGFVRG